MKIFLVNFFLARLPCAVIYSVLQYLIRWEEEGKGKGEDFCTETIFHRMAKLQFPGAHRFTYYKV
jgi:hypothetical protein